MKPIRLSTVAVVSLVLVAACEEKKPDPATERIARLEKKAAEATARQQELERQLADQKLAAEREAIERERMEIEEAREALERKQGEAALAEAEQIRRREQELATREGKVITLESTLAEKEQDLREEKSKLTEQERELAGREAVSLEADDAGDETPVGDYGMFYDSLSSYGSWFETPDYGYVWQPVAVRDGSWRPYTRGRWVCSNQGWTWLSDEPFGWATYHYGRWALCRGYGWIWVPGCEWAPSWVSWRSNGSHIGWAPLPPESMAYTTHRWDANVDVTLCIGAAWFNFVELRHFCEPIHRFCLPYARNREYYGGTSNITNIHVKNRRIICGGPRYEEINRHGVRPVPFYRLEQDHGKPGRDVPGMRPRIEEDRLRVVAPNIKVDWNDRIRPKIVKSRLETVTIDREEAVRPEVKERFRRVREENLMIADRKIAELGGAEAFQQQRDGTVKTKPGPKVHPPAEPVRGRTAENLGERNDRTAVEALRPEVYQKPEEDRRDMEPRDSEAAVEEPRRPAEGPRVSPPKTEDRERTGRIEPSRVAENRREPAQDRTRKEEDRPRIAPSGKADRPEAGRITGEHDESAKKEKQREAAEQADRMRRHQQDQEEAARRDQQRRQQAEEAKREQQRQREDDQRRQMEEQRREQQREEARREQQREQAREQQREEARREQQREQAKEQQREEARREQQREQSRREEENRRDQERSRQQRDNDDKQRKNR